MKRKKLAVLVSGTGSILQAMIEGERLPIALVIADRPCKALGIAEAHSIPTRMIPRTFGKSFGREAYTMATVEVLKQHAIELVAMAGYLTILSPAMFMPENFGGKTTNIHPSLLPLFKGDHAVADALAAGVKVTGTTIHWATERLDDERFIIAQREVFVLPNDTVESLHERIKRTERILYPGTIRTLMESPDP